MLSMFIRRWLYKLHFTEGKVVSYPYSVGSEEPTDNRTLHSFAYVLPDVTPEHSLALKY